MHVHEYFKSQPFIKSHQHLTPNAVFSSFFLQNDSFRPLIIFKIIKRARKLIPHPKISESRYIGHVSYSFGLKVMVLAFWVAAILEICKLGIFHPRETWELSQKLERGILSIPANFGLCP